MRCGIDHRQTAVNAQTTDSGDRLDLADQPLQVAVRYRQRITAGQDHFPYRVIASDVIKGL
jgi:hypothetical protein